MTNLTLHILFLHTHRNSGFAEVLGKFYIYISGVFLTMEKPSFCVKKYINILSLICQRVYFIILALVTFFVAFALISCNTDNPAEHPNDNNSQDSTIVQNPNYNDNLNIPEITPLDKSLGCLNGAFAIGKNKYVHFSQGNLQYTQSTNTWSFAEQQYEILAERNLKNAKLTSDNEYGRWYKSVDFADKIDLFGWSGSIVAKWGVKTSTDYSDYSGDFVDWGNNSISNGGNKFNQWRTLTSVEWKYIISDRPNAFELQGVAQVNGVNGLILLPDNWTLPAGLSFKSGFADTYSAYAYAPYQSYTQYEWTKMESAGAVFLPASGCRYATYIYGIDYNGYYWSATPYTEEYGAYSLRFLSDTATIDFMDWSLRYYGLSVRLVSRHVSFTDYPQRRTADSTKICPSTEIVAEKNLLDLRE